MQHTLQHTATHTATHRNTLTYLCIAAKATHCNTLQHTATHCNTLQHIGHVAWYHFLQKGSILVGLSAKEPCSCQSLLQKSSILFGLFCKRVLFLSVSCAKDTLQHTATHCNTLGTCLHITFCKRALFLSVYLQKSPVLVSLFCRLKRAQRSAFLSSVFFHRRHKSSFFFHKRKKTDDNRARLWTYSLNIWDIKGASKTLQKSSIFVGLFCKRVLFLSVSWALQRALQRRALLSSQCVAVCWGAVC